MLLAALTALAMPLAGHSLLSSFDHRLYGVEVSSWGPLRKELSPEEGVASVIARMAEVENAEGDRLLPLGTMVDSVTLGDGILAARITLPKGPLREPAYLLQASEILRYFFGEKHSLTAIRVRYRFEGEPTESYRSGDHIIVELEAATTPKETTPDWELNGPGPQPPIDYDAWEKSLRAKNVAGQAGMATSGGPAGALSGRIIFTYGGHGRTWDGDASTPFWRFQRGVTNGMMEDFGNVDGSDPYAYHCFNAGATIVPLRPIGYQNNEVVLDNVSADVTFAGAWSNSSSPRYWGSGTPYRFATSSATETATATYTPNIPSAGYYPIYTWVNFGSDRIPGQLYRIRSTGGDSVVRVNHRKVGCGWVYLGTHYFNAGKNAATGSVVISNLELPSTPNSGSYVIIADAIRFGNGMGVVNKGGGVSGFSRREESTVYWIQDGWGVGNSNATSPDTAKTANQVWNSGNAADDETWSLSAPPEMAAAMHRLEAGAADLRKFALFLSWHSNAATGTARGSIGLITGAATANQAWWAARVSDRIDQASLEEDDNWASTWNDRSSATLEGGYGEISTSNIGTEMDATIIEAAFHDNATDAGLLRDPRVRQVHGRATYRAAVEYFNNFQGGTLAYLPEPPIRFSVANDGNGGVVLRWAAGPTGGTKGGAATAYRIYRSPDGLGFDGGTAVAGTTTTIAGLTVGETYYFRVTGTNAGGESFPTDTLAVRVRANGGSRVLIVNGYDRLDRFNNIVRTAVGAVDQLITERNNAYNYVRAYAPGLAAQNISFDSCDNETIIAGTVTLANYDALTWIAGEESTRDNTFNATERTAITNFLNLGDRSLLVSGAEIGFEMQSVAVDTAFFQNVLRANYSADDGGSYQATGVAGTLFAGLTMNFTPTTTNYDADFPDRLATSNGSVVCLNYTGTGSGGAAVQYSGGSPSRKVVTVGFPLECVASASERQAALTKTMEFFGVESDSASPLMWMLR
jgi:hypothetical protein